LSEEQRKLNCELYNLEMELDLDRSHHFWRRGSPVPHQQL
jgi:hypothetical protein